MPHFYFHFGDGKRTFTDSTGIELNGIAAARAYATNQIRDMRTSVLEGSLQDWSSWKMIVTDAKEMVVFEIGFDLTPRPR
jgi:hypothetical protein